MTSELMKKVIKLEEDNDEIRKSLNELSKILLNAVETLYSQENRQKQILSDANELTEQVNEIRNKLTLLTEMNDIHHTAIQDIADSLDLTVL